MRWWEEKLRKVEMKEVGVVPVLLLHILPILLNFLYKNNMLKLITPWAYHICYLSHSHINDHNTLFDSFECYFNTLVSNYLALWDDFFLFHILYETFKGYLLAISVLDSWFTRCEHESIYYVIHILYVFKLMLKLISLMMFSLKLLYLVKVIIL